MDHQWREALGGAPGRFVPPGSAEEQPGCVIFDLDGVLARHDTFSEFVRRRAVRRPWLLPPVALTLPALAVTSFSPRLRRHPASWAATASMLGCRSEELRRNMERLGAELARDPRWRVAAATARAHEHLARGDRVITVTASEHHLARGYLDGLDLAAVELVASQVHQTASGCCLRPHNYGEVKARRLTEMVPPPWSRLYTDSLADLPLMRKVGDVVLVNADERTRRATAAQGVKARVEHWQ